MTKPGGRQDSAHGQWFANPCFKGLNYLYVSLHDLRSSLIYGKPFAWFIFNIYSPHICILLFYFSLYSDRQMGGRIDRYIEKNLYISIWIYSIYIFLCVYFWKIYCFIVHVLTLNGFKFYFMFAFFPHVVLSLIVFFMILHIIFLTFYFNSS